MQLACISQIANVNGNEHLAISMSMAFGFDVCILMSYKHGICSVHSAIANPQINSLCSPNCIKQLTFKGGNGGGALGANKARTHPVIAIFVYPLGAVEAACGTGGGALGANKANTHHVIAIFLYPLGAVEAACALEVNAIGALDLVEV
ncbi:hypothetical protein Tco_0084181 [Tanacetum coccineum]